MIDAPAIPALLPRRLGRAAIRFARLAGMAAAAAALLFGFEWMRLPDLDRTIREVRYSTIIADREGRPIRYALTSGQELAPRVALGRIAPAVLDATLAAEDGRFRSHWGVDGAAVARAAAANLRHGRIVSGASTITMQTARLLRPLPRGYYNKFREMVLSWWIERRLSKDEILELYLNLAPYGGNCRGIEAAALRYFGRHADDLCLGEAALLAGLPQAPSRLRPDRHAAAARRRRDWVLGRMAALGSISPAAAEQARASSVNARWHPLPLEAPHFTEWVRRRSGPGDVVRTTLDPALQRMAEEVITARLADLEPLGVADGALLIAETATGRIRAWVGSGDFRAPRAGQVNGPASPRSPGSLLKPFIYALAFERGIAGPDTVLEDRPLHFRDGYGPGNFGGRFLGTVTARDALLASLNIPAVDLLRKVGVGDAIQALRSAGLRAIRSSPGEYGLSLALGGVEVTLRDLIEAYAALGRLGEHRPLLFREDDRPQPPGAGRWIFDAGAAHQVASILELGSWTDAERGAFTRLPRIAVKTGTSFGRRDAWAIGYNPAYTAGVWLGNFDGAPSEALVGREAAVPALLDLFRRLPPSDREWFEKPFAAAGPPFPSSLAGAGGPKLDWISPADGAVYVRHARKGGDRMQLLAEVSPPQGLTWFIDGRYAGASRSGEALEVPLAAGAHRVVVVDRSGRSESRSFRVAGR